MNKRDYTFNNIEEAMLMMTELELGDPNLVWNGSRTRPRAGFKSLNATYPIKVFVYDDHTMTYAALDPESSCPNQEAPDPVNHPSHYTDGQIEVIDYIEDKKLGYHLGNAVKYISRAGKKDPEKEVEDLQKAVWYINRKIEKLQQAKAARRQELEACRS